MMVSEKRNNSNDPSEKQPIDEMGRYAKKSESPSLEVSSEDVGLTFDGLEDIEASEDFDFEGLEGIEDIPEDFVEKNTERMAYDYSDVNIFGMSQEDAKKKSDDLTDEIHSIPNCWVIIDKKFGSKFQDQRSRYGCLLALEKVVKDFPQMAKALKKIDISTETTKGKYSITWGNARLANIVYGLNTKNWKYEWQGAPDSIHMCANSHGNPTPCTGSTGQFAKSYQSSSMHDTLPSPEEAVLNVMFHESGHIIHYQLITEAIGKAYFDKPKDVGKRVHQEAAKIRDEIIDIAIQDNPDMSKKDFLKDTSQYGMSNPMEWFAETFSSMYCSKPRKAALAMRKYLEEKFK